MDFPIYDEIKSEDRFFYVRIEIYLKMPQKFRKFVPMYALSKESRAVMTHLPELIYFVRKENYLFMINTLTSNDNFYYYAFKKIEKNIFLLPVWNKHPSLSGSLLNTFCLPSLEKITELSSCQ